jgi:hypothetical protein
MQLFIIFLPLLFFLNLIHIVYCFFPNNRFQKLVYLKSNKILNIEYKKNKEIQIIDELNKKYIFNKEDFNDNLIDLEMDSDTKRKINKIINYNNSLIFSPGGYYGFYNTGVGAYIKKNYDISNYNLHGASAGAWSSLFLSYKYDLDDLSNLIFNLDTNNIKSLITLQKIMKDKLLENFTLEDFDSERIYISVSVFEDLRIKNYIYTDFKDLEELVDCCISSSNIPFISGSIFNRFNKKFSYDGGIFTNFFVNFINSKLTISNEIWGNENNFINSLEKQDGKILFINGYCDSYKNKDKLDKIFNQEFV